MLSQAGDSARAPADAWQVIFSGGITGITILFALVVVSVIAMALVVEHLVTIRRDKLIPDGLAEKVRQHLSESRSSDAIQECQHSASALSDVIEAGVQESLGGWLAVEKGMEEALAEQSAKLLRKIDYLSVIGNIAPMIGLLGTVVGMIFAFQEVANTQGAARAAELASGIYQALVTTVGGLIVAIPSLAAFAVFRNRVDQLIAETGQSAQYAVTPLKRRFQSGAPQPPPVALK
ncbi:MAG: MotA/TolQ/ExbB proton channel family protein [Planctomycetota bacterium]